MPLLKISKFLRNNVIAILINSTVRPRDMQIHGFKLVPKALEIYTDFFRIFIKNLDTLENLEDFFMRILCGEFLGFYQPHDI